MEDVNRISVIRKKRNYARDLAQTLVSDVTVESGSWTFLGDGGVAHWILGEFDENSRQLPKKNVHKHTVYFI